MRRLLAFGTGAAVIGLILLLVAFYESYIIVSQLQREIAQQGTTDVNLLLEDATLEAIFLGVMVALGYGLVSQGFSGIRRQELLDLEGTADDEITKARVMARIERERASEKVRPKGLRMPAVPIPAKESAKTSFSPRKFTSIPEASSEPASNQRTEGDMIKDSTNMQATPQPMVVAETTSSSVMEDTTSPPQVLPTVEVEQPSTRAERMMAEAPKAEEATIDLPDMATQGEAQTEAGSSAAWEESSPSAVERVEGMQETSNNSMTVESSKASIDAGQIAQSEQDSATLKPKRGRGRPKGSKSSKKKTDEVS